MKRELFEKLRETAVAVIPVAVIVLLLNFIVAPMPKGIMALFLSGTFFLIIGMTLFQIGSDSGMTPIGNEIGGKLVEMRNLKFFVITALVLGVLVTVAEPDLQVLGKQMPPTVLFSLFGFDMTLGTVLILAVAAGVGVFLMFAVVRTLFGWDLSRIFFILYIGVFILALFTKEEYLAVAFDSGGVTTGPVTVPFILALGVGIAAVRGKDAPDSSFGYVGLCSVGPIITVLIMGIFAGGNASAETSVIPEINSFGDLVHIYAKAFIDYAEEVAIALSPILAVYLLFQIFLLKLPNMSVAKTLIGVGYTYVGLVIFLAAANTGFMPAGSFMGGALASCGMNWLIVPVGMTVGFFIVAAEPAVHVLTEQVEEVTGGAITRKAMMTALMLGMCVSVGLAMIRVITGISIWFFLIPGYAVALGLMFFVPKIFTAIAFDSGGVASGPMTATFLLPFATGACSALGGNILLDGFGVVAMVAMTPLVTIQILGAVYAFKARRIAEEEKEILEEALEEIGDIEEEMGLLLTFNNVEEFYDEYTIMELDYDC